MINLHLNNGYVYSCLVLKTSQKTTLLQFRFSVGYRASATEFEILKKPQKLVARVRAAFYIWLDQIILSSQSIPLVRGQSCMQPLQLK